jgi:enoyl-CoA hydratase/carnithine racemase
VAEGARAILLRSSMRHFCIGAEVQSFGTTAVIHTDKEKFVRVMDVLENVPVSTVAALNGGVLGGGVEIALIC